MHRVCFHKQPVIISVVSCCHTSSTSFWVAPGFMGNNLVSDKDAQGFNLSAKWSFHISATIADSNAEFVLVTAVIHFTSSSPFVSKSDIPSWTCVSATSSWLHKRKGQSRVWQQRNFDITEGHLVHLDMTKRVAKIAPMCDELVSKDELSRHNSWWHDPTATHCRAPGLSAQLESLPVSTSPFNLNLRHWFAVSGSLCRVLEVGLIWWKAVRNQILVLNGNTIIYP